MKKEEERSREEDGEKGVKSQGRMEGKEMKDRERQEGTGKESERVEEKEPWGKREWEEEGGRGMEEREKGGTATPSKFHSRVKKKAPY